MKSYNDALNDIFPRCRAILGVRPWSDLLGGLEQEPAGIPDFLEQHGGPGMPPFLPGLARVELARHQARQAAGAEPQDLLSLNPTLRMTAVDWKNLPALCAGSKRRAAGLVEPGPEIVISWRPPGTGEVVTRAAREADLLAVKLAAEEIDPAAAARETGIAAGVLDAILRQAVEDGILCRPQSLLRRRIPGTAQAPETEQVAEVFSLQWHLTQQCDLHCRHCYDRSDRHAFPYDRALSLLDELGDFCRRRFIRGQVSLSGGNPLMYPHFFDLYRAAAERDLFVAILGNACDRATLERLLLIAMPAYYQVSLEGLEQHNDEIRGAGNFRRTVDFLKMASEMGIPNMVMLTLTGRNMDQVLPLARELQGVTDGLAFNRLALFGEGAKLTLPSPEEYRGFLEGYAAARKELPVLWLKDSLLNTVFEQKGSGLFGGCAGYGCGAAFNFVSVLSDGEVHACRKFPSPIGNILSDTLEAVYASPAAARYRAGSTACAGCPLNGVCRGCPAVTASMGLDPFTEKDPFCLR